MQRTKWEGNGSLLLLICQFGNGDLDVACFSSSPACNQVFSYRLQICYDKSTDGKKKKGNDMCNLRQLTGGRFLRIKMLKN